MSRVSRNVTYVNKGNVKVMYFFKIQLHYQLHLKRAITLPNIIGDVIDFNYFSITLKVLHISGQEIT